MLLQKIRCLVHKISKIRHKQAAFQILVLSANARVAHLLRTSSAVNMDQALAICIREFDSCILDCFKSIIACPDLTEQHIHQIRLPERLSGLGLLSAQQMAPTAFLGSARQTLSELSSRGVTDNVLSMIFQHQQLDESIPWCLEIQQNWNKYASDILHNNPATAVEDWSSNMFLALQPRHLQKSLLGASMTALQQCLLQSSDLHDKIRIQSCAATGAGAFLRAPKILQGAHFSNLEFQLAVKLRIGAPLNLLCPPTCICGNSLDDRGDHMFKCRIGNEWFLRHSSMVHIIASIMKSVQYTVQHEVNLSNLGPLRSLDTDGSGIMDLVVTSSDSQTLLADVTITHPIPAASTTITEAMLLPLHFAKQQENRKIRRYGELVRLMQHTFSPFAFETFGASGPAFQRHLKYLASRYTQNISGSSENDDLNRSTLIRYWRTKISCCLQRANARLLISKANRIRANLRQGSPPNVPDISETWTLSKAIVPVTFLSLLNLIHIFTMSSSGYFPTQKIHRESLHSQTTKSICR